MRTHLPTAVAILMAAGCKTIFFQDDGFTKELDRGCQSATQCDALVAKAERRVDTCKPNTIGAVPCKDARADLRQTKSIRDAFLEHEREREAAIAADKAVAQQAETEAARVEQETAEAAAAEALRAFELGPRLAMSGPVPDYRDLPERCAPIAGQSTNPFTCDQGVAWDCTTSPYDGCTETGSSTTWCCPGTGCSFSRALTRICRDQLHQATLGIACSEGHIPSGCEYVVLYQGKIIHCCNILR